MAPKSKPLFIAMSGVRVRGTRQRVFPTARHKLKTAVFTVITVNNTQRNAGGLTLNTLSTQAVVKPADATTNKPGGAPGVAVVAGGLNQRGDLKN